jgi:hypothetical protein
VLDFVALFAAHDVIRDEQNFQEGEITLLELRPVLDGHRLITKTLHKTNAIVTAKLRMFWRLLGIALWAFIKNPEMLPNGMRKTTSKGGAMYRGAKDCSRRCAA